MAPPIIGPNMGTRAMPIVTYPIMEAALRVSNMSLTIARLSEIEVATAACTNLKNKKVSALVESIAPMVAKTKITSDVRTTVRRPYRSLIGPIRN